MQGSVHEVVADVRVDGQGAVALMADLLLDEPAVDSVLGQMRDVWKFTTTDLDDLLARLDRHTADHHEESSAGPAP